MEGLIYNGWNNIIGNLDGEIQNERIAGRQLNIKYIERIYEISSWQLCNSLYTILRESQFLRK